VSKGLAEERICPVSPGDIVAGKYRVDRMLGSGGMGVVVAATQTELDRPVALKFLLPEILAHPDLVARFAREARVAAKLQSEHAARVLDVGALDEDGPYIVMEFLDGEDLAWLLAQRGPLPFREAVGYVLEAAEAVAEAHALGIVHRDIKPANLFLAKRTSGPSIIKVLDFGLSKFSDLAGAENVTSATGLFGTPAYMSPEQLWSARNADGRSDIWSLGVVLYELLTAHSPFPHERMPELIAGILNRPVTPIDRRQTDVPHGLEAIVVRCMEKNPAERFENIAHLARALAPFGPPWSERSAERIAHTLATQPELEPQAREEMPTGDASAGDSGARRKIGGSGSVPEATDTLRVTPLDSASVAPVGRPARRSLGGRKTTMAWGLGAVAVASLGAVAVSVVVRTSLQREGFGSSRVPSPEMSAPLRETELAPPLKREVDSVPSSKPADLSPVEAAPVASAASTQVSPPAASTVRPAVREPPKKVGKGLSTAPPAASASAGSGKMAAPASSELPLLDPLNRLKPM
jgi:serine/threonine-protein kinase